MTDLRNPREPLAQKARRGSLWLFSSYALSRLGRVAMMLIAAALLSPREYGIIGLSAVVITVGQIINEFGIWQTVVYQKDLDERFLNTAFAANICGGLITVLGIYLSAPWIADFYGEPEITVVLRVMGLALLFDAIFYVPDGLLRKELEFKSRALPEVAGTFGAGVVTVALLLLGVGVLSYAIGFVVESAVRCVLTLRKISWRPRLQLSWLFFREMTYARHILGGNLARHISSNVDYLIVGRVLGAGPLGFYTLAFNLANYPVSNLAQILSRILFPTLATLQENPDYAKRVYLKVVRLVAAVVTPTLMVLALLAAPLLVGLFGEKWQPAVLPLQLMVVAGVFRAVAFPSSDMLRAFGSPEVPFRINVLEGLLLAGTLVLVAPRGIVVVALTVAVVLSLTSCALTIVACRAYEIGLRELGQAVVPGVALAVSGAGGILLLKALNPYLLPDVLELVVLGAAAGVGMLLCLITVCRSLLREVTALAASGRAG